MSQHRSSCMHQQLHVTLWYRAPYCVSLSQNTSKIVSYHMSDLYSPSATTERITCAS